MDVSAPAQIITDPAQLITIPAQLITAPAQPPAIRVVVYTAFFTNKSMKRSDPTKHFISLQWSYHRLNSARHAGGK